MSSITGNNGALTPTPMVEAPRLQPTGEIIIENCRYDLSFDTKCDNPARYMVAWQPLKGEREVLSDGTGSFITEEFSLSEQLKILGDGSHDWSLVCADHLNDEVEDLLGHTPEAVQEFVYIAELTRTVVYANPVTIPARRDYMAFVHDEGYGFKADGITPKKKP